MDFTSIGSVNNYIKTIDMQNKWTQKKKSGNFSADGLKSMSEWVEAQQEKLNKSSYSVGSDDDDTQETDTKMSDIINKYAAGGKLTADEMDYLQKKNPLMYQRVKADLAEQESYEKELKNCRTKDEVQQVRMNHTAASLSAVNAIKNNPNIPAGTKTALMSTESRKLREMEKITLKFVKSGEYAKLPTEDEYRKAEKEIKEAEREALNIESTSENTEEASENNTVSQDTVSDVNKSAESTVTNEDTEAAKEIIAEDTAVSDTEKSEAEETVSIKDDKKTLAEAENSPEARKMKRSKAKMYLATATVSQPSATYNVVSKIDSKI